MVAVAASLRPSRREVLAAILGAPFVSALGCEREAPLPALEGEIKGPSIEAGHRLRDPAALRAWATADAEERRTGVAILGAGPAGLAAAWRLVRAGVEDFELYELEPEPGGTSASGRTSVTAHPWGAHYLPVPRPEHTALVELLREMDAWESRDAQTLIPREHLLVRAPEERVFYRGFWYPGLLPRVGMTADERAQLARFEALVARWTAFRDGQGRRAFDLPSSRCSDDAEVMALDRLSAAELCDREGITAPRVRWWLEYGTRDDYGLALTEASAWSLLFYHVARTETPGEESADFLTWPEGNGALVHHLARTAGRRVHTERMVVNVRSSDEGASVLLLDVRRDRPIRVQAEHVICALPRFVAARVVEGAAASDATYGPWAVANLHLRSRPAYRGAPPAWDNVIYDSPSLGYVSATHQRGRDFGPTVWTYYLPFVDADARAGRQRLFEHDWRGFADAIVTDLGRAHPDLLQHLERIDVWKWGHAMAQPRVGARSSPLRREALQRRGRISFAHSDLSALALFEEAFDHGVRAADEVIAARRERVPT